MGLATTLNDLIGAVCPIAGISIGKPNDKATWRIDFAANATDDQKAAAQAIVDAFDLEKESANAPIDNEISSLEEAEILARIVREYILVDAVNTVLVDQGIRVSQATAQQRAAAMAALTTVGSPLYSLGIAKLKAFDDSIVALRVQRVS